VRRRHDGRLPAAYPATNFHTENITQFAKDVDAATGGKLKITVHANGSLFKAPEIKRAVQGGQAQAGEDPAGEFRERVADCLVPMALPFLADEL
jgi:TRAP-type C4-dicarboxylate transport system substrate-binding protein